MRIVVAGSSGLIGTRLVAALRADGHEVTRLVRREPAGADEVRWQPAAGELDAKVLDGVDAAVNLAGAGVADRRWTDRYKEVLRSSRVDTTATLARATAAAGTPVLLNASAIGWYGDTGDREVTEEEPAGEGFLADMCRVWEAATVPAEEAGVRVARMRIGIVLTASGGVLKPLLPLFRLGLGGPLAGGRPYWPWISLADALGAVRFLLGSEVSGPVNVVGPAPVRIREFTGALGGAVHRPAFLPVPAFALRIAAGELAGNITASQRVLPGVLAEAGYRFQHPTLDEALRWALKN